MNIFVSTLSSPVSSSGYGSAEEDHHSLTIPSPSPSIRRYDPLSPSSDSGSGIFSFASTSSSSSSAQDDLLPEALGSIFGDLLDFEDELPHLDLSCGLNFSDNQIIDPTNAGITNDIMNGHTNAHLNDHVNDYVRINDHINDLRNDYINDHINVHINDHLNDHKSDHIKYDHSDDNNINDLNVPNDFYCLSDLCQYFSPNGIGTSDLDDGDYNYSSSTDPTSSSSIDQQDEAVSDGSASEDRMLLLLLGNTKSSPLNISTQSATTNDPTCIGFKTLRYSTGTSGTNTSCPVRSFRECQTLPKGTPNEVVEGYRPLKDNLQHSTGITGSLREPATKTAAAVLQEDDDIKNIDDCKPFTMLFEIISSGEAPPSSACLPSKKIPHLSSCQTFTELSKKELPQIRFPSKATPSAYNNHQQLHSTSSRTSARGHEDRSWEVASPSKPDPPSCTTIDFRQKSVSPSLHDPTLPSLHVITPIRTAGVRRAYSGLDDHRYSTTAPDSDPAPPSKKARTSSEVFDSGKTPTGSTRFPTTTGSGSRRSEKTILETFLLTTEKLHANKGSDAMLEEDRIARLYSGRHHTLPSVKSPSSTPTSSSSSTCSSPSLHKSSVLERLLTDGGRCKQESSLKNKEDLNSATAHHREDTTDDVRHAINAAATPCGGGVSNSMDSAYEQFESSHHFAHDSIPLQLGLLNDDLSEHVWTPSSIDDKVFSNEMEAIIGQNLNPSDIWMHQYISDLL